MRRRPGLPTQLLADTYKAIWLCKVPSSADLNQFKWHSVWSNHLAATCTAQQVGTCYNAISVAVASCVVTVDNGHSPAFAAYDQARLKLLQLDNSTAAIAYK
jgi:hypothetical protein